MFRGQFSIVALALGNFVVGLSILLPTGMLAELSSNLGVTIGTVGLLISLGAAVVCVSPPFVAWITSRIDRRVLLGAILLWIALGHAASAFAPNYPSLLVIRLAMLAFAGAFTPLAAGTAALLVPEDKRASAIASALLGWALAIAVGLPLISVSAPLIGWRATYSLVGMLAAVGFLALLVGLPKGLKGTPVIFATWRAVGRNRQLLLLLLITSLLAAGQLVVIAFVGPLLSDLTGATPRGIAIVFLFFGVMTLIGNVCASQVVRVWGPFKTSAVFMVCIVIGAALWAIGAGTFTLMAAGAAIWGLGFAAASAMQQVRLIAAAPALATASVAINNTALYLGQAIGSGIGSVLFVQGKLITMGFAALALVASSLGVLWLTRFAPERLGVRFDTDTIQLLARVFDQALERYLKNKPVVKDQAGLHSELARHIVAVAQTGERDEDRLATRGYLMLRSLEAATSMEPSFD
ncbi:MAG: major facilitator superfamily transporter [Bradyrhizobium sp.]|nr:major facilitator superfamily transporter [Bradyrhizobium sp.]